MTIVTCECQPVRNPLPNRYQIGNVVTSPQDQAFRRFATQRHSRRTTTVDVRIRAEDISRRLRGGSTTRQNNITQCLVLAGQSIGTLEQLRAKTELSDDSEFHRVNVALSERGFDGGDKREQPVERDHDHEDPESQARRHPAGHRANAIYGRQSVLKIERLLRLVGQPRVCRISARSQPHDERGDEQENRTANMS
jgi:hypothetical protein